MRDETVTTRRTDEAEAPRDALSLIGRSITRRECAKCGVAVGEVHADECPVDRHAPIVEVEYVRAADRQGAVEALREIVALEEREGDLGEGPGYWHAIGECADIARRALGGQ